MTREIPISRIDYGVNVRREKDEDIRELADSIEAFDVLQPLVVRPTGDNRYEVICGHRRLKALKKVGGDIRVPCILREDIEDKDVLQVQLEENIQRRQMNAEELVAAFDEIKRQHGGRMTNQELADMLHKNKSWVDLQYFALNTARKMYGGDAQRRIQKENLSAGQITGRYRKLRRKETSVKKKGYTVEHVGRIITIKCESYAVLCSLLKKLEG